MYILETILKQHEVKNVSLEISSFYCGGVTAVTKCKDSLTQLVVRAPHYHHTTIISIPKNWPHMPVLPIV